MRRHPSLIENRPSDVGELYIERRSGKNLVRLLAGAEPAADPLLALRAVLAADLPRARVGATDAVVVEAQRAAENQRAVLENRNDRDDLASRSWAEADMRIPGTQHEAGNAGVAEQRRVPA